MTYEILFVATTVFGVGLITEYLYSRVVLPSLDGRR